MRIKFRDLQIYIPQRLVVITCATAVVIALILGGQGAFVVEAIQTVTGVLVFLGVVIVLLLFTGGSNP